ncbi:hypothetical protein ACFX2G_008535 [Malus domestica]
MFCSAFDPVVAFVNGGDCLCASRRFTPSSKSNLGKIFRTINVNESAMVKKSGSAVDQALVRVAVKNGVPLFTFAVDNDIAILAAAMKKLNTSKNDDYSCICIFFSVREIKEKATTWMHQGSKSKSHD